MGGGRVMLLGLVERHQISCDLDKDEKGVILGRGQGMGNLEKWEEKEKVLILRMGGGENLENGREKSVYLENGRKSWEWEGK